MNLRPEDITVVVVRAAGYSGATWVNLVLGSHKDAMAMGPATRFFDLSEDDVEAACYIHREHCSLWPDFLKSGNHNGRFFEDLAKFTGKRVFIVNYPADQYVRREIENKGFRVLHLQVVRDGRANLYSKLRHDSVNTDFSTLEALLKWQLPKWVEINSLMPIEPSHWFRLKYEDLVTRPEEALNRLGSFLGLEYGLGSLRFWEFEHHLTAGNTGVIDTLCSMQNVEGWWHHRKNSYSEYTDRLRSNANEKYLDEEWRKELKNKDLLAFDCVFGAINETLGYERDVFSDQERLDFWESIREYDLNRQANYKASKKEKSFLSKILAVF